MSQRIPKQQLSQEHNEFPNISISDENIKRVPLISFQFINGMSGGCLESLYKAQRSGTKAKLLELQKFISEFSECGDISNACKIYSGKSLKIKKTNGYVNKIINKLHQVYPKLTGVVSDELCHIHAKRNGGGETVYFGFTYENIFNIIYIDSKHDFDK